MLSLGIVGAGKIVQEVLPFLKEFALGQIYICVRPQSVLKAQDLCAQYGLDGYCDDYQLFLKKDIDVLYLALPNHLHYSYAKQAIEYGKHVIVEKPITVEYRDLQNLMLAAKEHNVYLFEAMNIFHLPAYKSLKKDIGRIGTPKIVSLNYSQYSSRYNDFKNGVVHPVFDAEKGGGALLDINIYNIYFTIGIFGKPRRSFYFPNMEQNIDTSGVFVMQYDRFKSVCVGSKDCQTVSLCTLQGDKGSIMFESPVNKLKGYKFVDLSGKSDIVKIDGNKHRLYYEFSEFFRIVEEKAEEEQQQLLELTCQANACIDSRYTVDAYSLQ